MLLTCPQCETQYRLDPALLGTQGRTVRCTACGNIWLQPPVKQDDDDLIIPPPPEMEVEFQSPAVAPQPGAESFASLLRGASAAAGIPEAVKPARQEFLPPVITHRPMGMGAGGFGVSVFLLLLFLTLGPLLLVKTPLVRAWPALALVYRLAGVELQAPGEGLRFSEMTAIQKVSDDSKTFTLHAKLTNVSSQPVPYPALEVLVEDAAGKTKIWDFRAAQSFLKPGDAVPVDLDLDGAPEEGRVARLRVTGP